MLRHVSVATRMAGPLDTSHPASLLCLTYFRSLLTLVLGCGIRDTKRIHPLTVLTHHLPTPISSILQATCVHKMAPVL